MNQTGVKAGKEEQVWRLTGWLLGRLRGERRPQPSLTLVERIVLAPRQSLSLVEAEGRRLLVATSPEGPPTFYALDERHGGESSGRPARLSPSRARTSW
jgi:hypothetical protein